VLCVHSRLVMQQQALCFEMPAGSHNGHPNVWQWRPTCAGGLGTWLTSDSAAICLAVGSVLTAGASCRWLQ
jgi:hypothetical protein